MKNDLDGNPHNIDEWAWWYEEPRGINLVVEERGHDGSYIRTRQRLIPWGQIRAALARLDKQKLKRRA